MNIVWSNMNQNQKQIGQSYLRGTFPVTKQVMRIVTPDFFHGPFIIRESFMYLFMV